jgi:hypothetical protein
MNTLRLTLLSLAMGSLLFFLSTYSKAQESSTIEYAEIEWREGGYVLSANITMQLSERLKEAVSRGVALHFVLEFELVRERRWWFNERIANKTLQYRLSYQPITRQYRLSFGGLHQSMETLESALLTLQRLRNWPVLESQSPKAGERYRAGVQFRLDVSQLPRPFQASAIGSREWSLSTPWYHWEPDLHPPDPEASSQEEIGGAILKGSFPNTGLRP